MNQPKLQPMPFNLAKKLLLTKETLRELTMGQLQQVAGGFFEAPTENKRCLRLTLETACPPQP